MCLRVFANWCVFANVRLSHVLFFFLFLLLACECVHVFSPPCTPGVYASECPFCVENRNTCSSPYGRHTSWNTWSLINFICYNKSTSTMTECGCGRGRGGRLKRLELSIRNVFPNISHCLCVCVCLCVCGSCIMYLLKSELWRMSECVSPAGRCMWEKTYFCLIHRWLRRPAWLMEFTSVCTDELLWEVTVQWWYAM